MSQSHRYPVKTIISSLTLLLTMGLTGCSSTPSGPPRKAVEAAYIRAALHITEKSDPKLWHQSMHNLNNGHGNISRFKIQSCEKKSPGTWQCLTYNDYKGKPVHRLYVGLTHEGDHWSLDRGLTGYFGLMDE